MPALDTPLEDHVPMPADFRGLARAFLGKLGNEDACYWRAASDLLKPLIVRLRRYPGRPVQAELLDAFERGCHALPSAYRCDVSVQKDWKGCLVASELRLSEFRINAAMANWTNEEVTAALTFIKVAFDRQRPLFLRVALVCFLHHAVARCLERGRDRSDAALIHDMTIPHECIGRIRAADACAVAVPTRDGEWRGMLIALVEATQDGRAAAAAPHHRAANIGSTRERIWRNTMNQQTIPCYALIVFGGDCDYVDPDQAAADLQQAGYEVRRLPRKYKRRIIEHAQNGGLSHPDDDFIMVLFPCVDNPKVLDVVGEEIERIASVYAGWCLEYPGPLDPNCDPFDALFAPPIPWA